MNVVQFTKRLIVESKKDNITEYAYRMTYQLLLSFFPFLAFLMTVISFAQLDFSMLIYSTESFFPKEVYELIYNITSEIKAGQRSNWLSFSALFALYAGSGGFRAIMEGANRVTSSYKRRGVLLEFALSVVWALLFSFAITSALLGIVFGQKIVHRLSVILPFALNEDVLNILRLILPIIFVFILFLMINMFVPSRQVCLSCALPGTIFITVVWIAFTLLFGFYVNYFADFSVFYGAIGSGIIMLIWMQLTSVILLVGMEINSLLMELGITKPKGAS